MPSSSEVAKAKYQAMLEQAKINNAHRKYTSDEPHGDDSPPVDGNLRDNKLDFSSHKS
ncbi:uncharacterized protein BBA_09770 [Beauveria bassiana ARSEF 2860]|uniref:Uncharacterized protein n=1 Tax=Beauveria bassiana (strain ARSEF 2860) TaxID=655819 RepID=J4VRR6_BEAB2|nr:uncharacterized protein BBA_09770 [Beauveria bassiana ARSEF 2860]EJP61295.1 hypothetical protein BBA_09770 [Beauveria bassiana ARSEF 2860]